jgi:hypothetical protein
VGGLSEVAAEQQFLEPGLDCEPDRGDDRER